MDYEPVTKLAHQAGLFEISSMIIRELLAKNPIHAEELLV